MTKEETTSTDETHSQNKDPNLHKLGPDSKRPLNDEGETTASGSCDSNKRMRTSEDEREVEEVVDIPSSLNLTNGAQIQVQWDIHDDAKGSSYVKWWKATLLPHQEGRLYKLLDDNDATMVPIRTLQYEAFPEGGFDETSNEDVCFLTQHSLLNMSSMARAYWRLEEEKDWEPPAEEDVDGFEDDEVSVGSNANATTRETALTNVIDAVLERALVQSKTLEKMSKLGASQRCFMADKITQAKVQLVQTLMKQLEGNDDSFENVITPNHIKMCMEQLGRDMNM
eukprot:CAMPEP_0197827288 /NCGR_PEP_ID=MMETSP1437-20131217/4103_1 /TAXON_ID=49252 ORGANISM="Eucampia antarctica, Strain CCMP1452" /NCGR_SAMPLE_ID=MMETSP1437 /ASSEMBLY_ACC=CAM_ASM_001096 /LENGTH=281 /DNA_ID=CAMNT_0043428077 /DNA_START=71 /DNA_END=916 /DNA_ORIENTATION=+